MFGEKCPRCERRVSRKHDFCAYCGINLNVEDNLGNDELGFLGNDDNLDLKLPFGFNALMKPLMRELSKQMLELDRELKKEKQEVSKDKAEKLVSRHFSIHIGMPGNKPIRLDMGPRKSVQVLEKKSDYSLPKISDTDFERARSYPRVEPLTNVRRLSDKIVYELEISGVNSIDKVNVSTLEDGIEVKAIGNKKVYHKFIDVVLPLSKIQLKKGFLVLELGIK